MFKAIIPLLQSHICSLGLNESELLQIAERTSIAEYTAGESLYRAGEPVTNIFLIVHGRFRLSAPKTDGREQLVAYLGPGSQLGVLSILHEEGPPVNVAAEEPSTVLRISKDDVAALAEQLPLFRRNLLRLAGLQITDMALGRQARNQARRIAFLHSSPLTKPLVTAITRRLLELDEKIGLMGDDLSSQAEDAWKYSLIGPAGDFVTEEEIRQKIGQWLDCKRIIFDVQASLDNEQGFNAVARLMGLVDKIFFPVTQQNCQRVTTAVNQLVMSNPSWKHKIHLIWLLSDEDQVAPYAPDLLQNVNRDFKVKSAECDPRPANQRMACGIERIVHYLRGVQLGIALGGGAARGMAHIGVLQALEDAGLCIDMLAGTSSGAMTGIVYASGRSPEYSIERFTEDLKLKWLYRLAPGGGKWFMFGKYRSGAWDGMLRRYLFDWRLEQFCLPMQAVTVDLVGAREVVRDRGDAVQAILESINLPVLSKPINRDGMALVDGGILNTLPANVLVRSGATFVVAVNVSSQLKQVFAGNTPETPTAKMKSGSTVQTVLRMLSVQDKNLSAIGAGVADFTIAPDVSAIDISEFTRTPEIAAIGRIAAEQAMPQLRDMLYQVDPQLFPLEESLEKPA